MVVIVVVMVEYCWGLGVGDDFMVAVVAEVVVVVVWQ